MNRSPAIGREAFICPHCHAFCQQAWFRVYAKAADSVDVHVVTSDGVEAGLKSIRDEGGNEELLKIFEPLLVAAKAGTAGMIAREPADNDWPKFKVWNLYLSRCFACRKESVWLGNNIIHPETLSDVAPANDDLPDDLARDYAEAARVVAASPRAAAALLRLLIQKLCSHVLDSSSDINTMIGDLVKQGLPARVQRALDTVRVVGNEAVHPGVMDLRDDQDTALKLFRIVNVIADAMITQPKHIDALYEGLPPGKLEGIAQRDKPKA